jgi:hypothetical protein
MLHSFVCKLCTWSFKLLVKFCHFFRDVLQKSKESRTLWRYWYISLWHRETEKPPQPGFKLSTRGLALCVIIGSIWYTKTHLVLLRETASAKHRADIFGRAPQVTHCEHMLLMWLIDRNWYALNCRIVPRHCQPCKTPGKTSTRSKKWGIFKPWKHTGYFFTTCLTLNRCVFHISSVLTYLLSLTTHMVYFPKNVFMKTNFIFWDYKLRSLLEGEAVCNIVRADFGQRIRSYFLGLLQRYQYEPQNFHPKLAFTL